MHHYISSGMLQVILVFVPGGGVYLASKFMNERNYNFRPAVRVVPTDHLF